LQKWVPDKVPLVMTDMSCIVQVCINRLDNQFPDSPRVKPLHGLLLEAEGHYEVARLFYVKELKEDENNIVSIRPTDTCSASPAGLKSLCTGTTQTPDILASQPL